MKPLVSVIVPCRNEEKHIKLCIESILENDYGCNYIEIIVVDGLSTDKTIEKINEVKNEHPESDIRIISNERRITPVSFNLGIKASKGEYILIAGSRHILAKNYITACSEILEKNNHIGCVGGVVDLAYDSEKSEMIAYATSSAFGVGVSFRTTSDRYVDTVGTPFYRRNIFDEIGHFDETLVRNQDDELNYRARKHGYKIFSTSDTSIKYFVRSKFKDLFKQYFQYGYWKVFVNRKHNTITTFRQLIPVIFVHFLILGAIASLFNKTVFLFFLTALILYLSAGIFFAIRKTRQLLSVLKILYAFLVLHIGYGAGYTNGIIDFLVLKKDPDPKHTTLSR
jgi:glycosyltransferase involved in cell wall biosynthesis